MLTAMSHAHNDLFVGGGMTLIFAHCGPLACYSIVGRGQGVGGVSPSLYDQYQWGGGGRNFQGVRLISSPTTSRFMYTIYISYMKLHAGKVK